MSSSPLKPTASSVVQTLPTSPQERRRLAAWLGVMESELEQVFAACEGALPLGSPDALVVTEARTQELVDAGLPASTSDGGAPFQRTAQLLLRGGLLASLVYAVCLGIIIGLEPFLGVTADSWIYALIIPILISGIVAFFTLPTWLILWIIGRLRQRAETRRLAVSQQVIERLSQRDLSEACQAADAHARRLARQTIQAPLPEVAEQDLLSTLEACRVSLRRNPAPEAITSTEAVLCDLDAALQSVHADGFIEQTVSKPLDRLRMVSRAIHARNHQRS